MVAISKLRFINIILQSNEEFSKRYLSSSPVTWTIARVSDEEKQLGDVAGLPARLDWRAFGYVTPVRNSVDVSHYYNS